MTSTASPVTPAPERGAALVEEMLALAHQFVREGWCQGAPARDACARPVAPTSAFASSWSAPGALERAWGRHEDRFGLGLEAFERANLALAAVAGDVPQVWNDAPERTLPQVLDALAEALQLVAAPPEGHTPPKVDSITR